MRALRTVQTVPASTLVTLIKAIIQPPIEGSSGSRPQLRDLMLVILGLPTPSPTYRVESRKSLSVEDSTSLLTLLVEWAEMHVEKRAEGLRSWLPEEGSSTANPAPISPSLESVGLLPSLFLTQLILQQVIAHSSILLDSHLPLFVTHDPSHPLLLRLQSALEPLIAIQNQFRQLRAPVEAVLTLAKREQRKQAEREAKRAAVRAANVSMSTGRRGRNGKLKEKEREDRERESGTRLPEEMVGKWRVEDLVF